MPTQQPQTPMDIWNGIIGKYQKLVDQANQEPDPQKAIHEALDIDGLDAQVQQYIVDRDVPDELINKVNSQDPINPLRAQAEKYRALVEIATITARKDLYHSINWRKLAEYTVGLSTRFGIPLNIAATVTQLLPEYVVGFFEGSQDQKTHAESELSTVINKLQQSQGRGPQII